MIAPSIPNNFGNAFSPMITVLSVLTLMFCLSCSPKKAVSQSSEGKAPSSEGSLESTSESQAVYGSKQDLCNCWKHDRENEDGGAKYKTYRPCDSKDWPASRFRQSYSFQKNGTCQYLFLAPTDGHYNKDATYDFDSRQGKITLRSPEGDQIMVLKLIKLTKDEMLIQK